MPNKNLVGLYSLTICLISTLIIMLILALSFMSLSDLLLPEYKYRSQLDKFANNDNYIEYKVSIGKPEINLDSNTIDAKRNIEKKKFLQSKKDDILSSFIDYLSWFVVSIIFFLFHWKLYKRSKVD